MTFAVSMTGIAKSFGTVQALDNIDLHVRKGTIHAVVGENGAGKTTLMRILYGALQPGAGQIELDGAPIRFPTSHDAIEAGIGMVSQHYGIIPELTCLQNLVLGSEGGVLLNHRAATKRAGELASRMDFSFDWNRPAQGLSPSATQKLEILKLLWKNARIMILDEPTAMLSPADGNALFTSLKQLVEEGATVILVTHRLPEVFNHCSYVTVLRGGRRVAEMEVSATNDRDLAQMIVGGALTEPPARAEDLRDELLRVEGLTVRGRRGEEALKNVSFTIRSGEVLGIAGVDGSGQRELIQALAGLRSSQRGSLHLDGEDMTSSRPSERISRGLRLIPEDRHNEGVVEDWSLEENAALGQQRLAPFARGTLIDVDKRRVVAEAIADRFDTRRASIRMPMRSLSGGNQQRFVAARALQLNPKLILAFQPARGLDLNSTTKVYEGIRQACRQGAGALVVSFDLDELLEYCDRVVVTHRGELVDPGTSHSLDREAIGRLMVGAR
ncbi:MAG TPA: ABC transporter ATP-binding protein [Fimbriimonadaceae bacterium]|nr:ABC transporter ATP-binding protein [Fimbriimonadaceae bacterium]